MSAHHLDLTINRDCVTMKFRCTAKDNDDVATSKCRWFCATCEEECSCGFDAWTNHLDYCRETEGWFDDGLEECYDGEETEFHSGLVEFTWDGDGYFWHYAPEPAEPDEPLFDLTADGQIAESEATK